MKKAHPEKKAKYESDERFQLLFQQAPLSYQSLDVNGCFVDVNQRWLELFGYKREEVIGKWFGDFLSPEYVDVFKKRFPLFKKNGAIHNEFHVVHKNGNKLFVSFEGKIVYDDNNHFERTHCILQDITQQKQYDELLRQSEAKLNFYMDNSPMGIVECDSDYVIIRWTGEAEKIFGWKAGEMLGKSIFEAGLIYEPDKEGIQNIRERIFQGENNHIFSCNRNYRKDGTVITCEWYNIVSREDNGKMKSVLSTILDITKRKELEQTIVESEARYRTIFENAGDGIAIIDNDKNIISANVSFARMHRYTLDEILNLGIKDLDTPESFKKSDELLAEITGERSVTFETNHYTKDGDIIPLEANAKPFFVDNKQQCLVVFYRDVTVRKQLEKKLRKSEEYFRSIFENNSVAISIIEPDSTISKVNNRFVELFGYNNDEVSGTNWTSYIYHEDIEPLKEFFSSGTMGSQESSSMYEFRFVRKDGEIREALMNVVVLSNNKVVASYLDITEHKQMVSELILAKEKAQESDRLKSTFLTNMSHEIRTPMNGIIGFAELLKETNLTSVEKRGFIDMITKSGARLLDTINDIIDISKIESGMIKTSLDMININDKLDFIYSFFRPEAEEKGIQFLLTKKLKPEEAIINTDDEKVYSVLSNLVKNAIKFTNDGSIEFGCEAINGYVRFYVKDTGMGIPEESREFIFDRFRQGSESILREYEGSGLGLSISKNYVEMLGGKIWFESETGKGTDFFFTLPYSETDRTGEGPTAIDKSDGTARENRQLKILLVEDDEVSYSLLKMILKEISSETLRASNGLDAVRLCRENPDIDVVLMDIRMPEMNGLEATRQIRQFNNDLVIIAQTAYGFSSDCEMALDAGCNDYLSKPISRKALIDTINKYCFK